MPAQQIMSAQLTRSDQKIAEIARRTLDRLLASRVSDDDVWRVDRAPAVLQLEDVAHLIRACLDYGDLTGEDEYYSHARVLAKHVMDRLGDIPGGTLEEMPLTHLAMVGADGDFGSAVGVFAQGLVRLFRRDGDEKYSRQAEFFCRRAIMLNVERLPRLGAVGRALWQLSEAKRSGK